MRNIFKTFILGLALAGPAPALADTDAVQRDGVRVLSGDGFDVISIRIKRNGEHQFFAADNAVGRVLVLDSAGAVLRDDRVERWDVFSDEAMHALDNGTLKPLPVRTAQAR